MAKNMFNKIGFGFGKASKKEEEKKERAKRDDDIHIEICQLSDNE